MCRQVKDQRGPVESPHTSKEAFRGLDSPSLHYLFVIKRPNSRHRYSLFSEITKVDVLIRRPEARDRLIVSQEQRALTFLWSANWTQNEFKRHRRGGEIDDALFVLLGWRFGSKWRQLWKLWLCVSRALTSFCLKNDPQMTCVLQWL